MRVRDAMIPDPLVIPPTMTCLQFVHTVLAANQTTASVVDGGNLVGMVSVKDIFRSILPHYIDMDERLASVVHDGFFEEEFEKLKHTAVREIMTSDVATIEPGAALLHAVAMFVRQDRKTIPVLEEGRYLGSITRRSVLAAVTREAKA